VLLEPHNRNWLFALELPASVPAQARYLDDGQLIQLTPVRARISYEIASAIESEPNPGRRRPMLERARRLPPGFNPARDEPGAGLARRSATDAQVTGPRDRLFSSASACSTRPRPPLLGRDSVDEFLTTPRGVLRAFSSAFVFLMRAAGVPARVVTGYQGGDMNPVDGKFTVRQSDAHAWSEVFIAGRGWIRVDPTVLSVPLRLDAGLARVVRRAMRCRC
jgi:hypothetical protein